MLGTELLKEKHHDRKTCYRLEAAQLDGCLMAKLLVEQDKELQSFRMLVILFRSEINQMTCRTVLEEKKNDSQPSDYVLAEERSDGCQNGLLEVQRVLVTKRFWRECGARAGLLLLFFQKFLKPVATLLG
jgi:hypothetical protein